MNTEVFELWGNSTTMEYYKSEEKTKSCAVIIFPGGGYWGRAEHEGKGYARFLNRHGIDAFVVNYRVHPNRFPLPLLDARRAVRYVRYYAEKFGIDKDRIAVMGSSAGGHLASMLCTYREKIEGEGIDEIDTESFLPDKQILCYPVINLYDEKITHIGSGDALLGDSLQNGGDIEMRKALSANLIADEKTPEAFIWHTFEDEAVDVKNTLQYATRLREAGVLAEVHIYPKGRHGLGLADEEGRNEPHVALWGESLIKWIDYIGW
ncbi:MAG: alpha/beta hydrolase [Clostridia bacterium]|nr:alpha/beta hydrolase [Clostridia bacterium]